MELAVGDAAAASGASRVPCHSRPLVCCTEVARGKFHRTLSGVAPARTILYSALVKLDPETLTSVVEPGGTSIVIFPEPCNAAAVRANTLRARWCR